MFEIVVRRVGGVEWVSTVTGDMVSAVLARAAVVTAYRKRGFWGGCNKAGVYRLSKRVDGTRVRLAVFIRHAQTPSFSLN